MIAYGIDCLWWDSAVNAAVRSTLLGDEVCCPHCGGRCGVYGSRTQFLDLLRRFELIGFTGFREMMIWSRGKCYKTRGAAWAAYRSRPLVILPQQGDAPVLS